MSPENILLWLFPIIAALILLFGPSQKPCFCQNKAGSEMVTGMLTALVNNSNDLSGCLLGTALNKGCELTMATFASHSCHAASKKQQIFWRNMPECLRYLYHFHIATQSIVYHTLLQENDNLWPVPTAILGLFQKKNVSGIYSTHMCVHISRVITITSIYSDWSGNWNLCFYLLKSHILMHTHILSVCISKSKIV